MNVAFVVRLRNVEIAKCTLRNPENVFCIFNKEQNRMAKKSRPILYSNLLYKMCHYFLDTQYNAKIIIKICFLFDFDLFNGVKCPNRR